MTGSLQPAGSPAPATPAAATPVALVDLLDRVLARGVVLSGEVVLSIAEVDLVYISLRALISSVRRDLPASCAAGRPMLAGSGDADGRRADGR